jgi:diadenosine tetraphosphate (Ap4A) HIT family hydrolase
VSDCPFCAILEHRAPAVVVSEGRHCMAFVPLRPAVYGHVLVVPREHARRLWHVPTHVLTAVVAEVQRLASLAAERLGATGVNVVVNNGESAGQTIEHLHLHVLPRRAGDELGPLPLSAEVTSARYDDEARERMANDWLVERELAR